MRSVERIHCIESCRRAKAFQRRNADFQSSICCAVGSNHAREKCVIVETCRLFVIDLTLQIRIGVGACRTLVRDRSGVSGNRSRIRRNVRVVAIDLTLKAGIRSRTGRTLVRNRSCVGGNVHVVAVDLSLKASIGTNAGSAFVRNRSGIG